MNSNNDNKNSQEIDLHFLWNKFIELIDKVGFLVFRFFRFVFRNIYIVVTLIVVGTALGYFLDIKTPPTYRHQIILALNFDSSTFLYNKVKKLDKKEFPDIQRAEVEPLIDVVSFVSEKWENLKTAEFMSENNIKIHQHKEGSQTEKIYRYHKLTLTSNQKDEKGSVIDAFLDKINQEPYYLKRQKIEIGNTIAKIREYEKSVEALNAIFESLGTSSPIEGGGIKIETQAQTNDLLNNKQNLMDKISKLKIIQSEQSKVFYDLARITNTKVKPTSYILTLPLIFIFLFTVFVLLKKLYKKYTLMQVVKN